MQLPQLTQVDGGADDFISCSSDGDVTITITPGDAPDSLSPFWMASPLGAESDRDCDTGETHTTKAMLVDLPGVRPPVPLVVGGNGHYNGTRITHVTVLDWNGSDKLTWPHGQAQVILTPTNPSADLPSGDWFFDTSQWDAQRVADSDPFQNPRSSSPWPVPRRRWARRCPGPRGTA